MSPEDVAPLPSGAGMPLVGLGTWQLRGRAGTAAVRHALRVGYRHVDTATMYGNEDAVGAALRESGVPREEVFLTTKVAPRDLGRERRTLEASLRALGVDRLDLWLVHWPRGAGADVELWERMLAAREEGLVRDVGVSNYSPAQVDELVAATGVAPAVNQVEWSPLRYDAARLQHSRDRRVVLEGYSPFRAARLEDPVLLEIATAHRVTPSQVIIRWHVDHGVVVIPKSARPSRIEANLDVFGFSLGPEELRRIDATSTVG
jgi:2,5-diketo-D-gluconate reductase A